MRLAGAIFDLDGTLADTLPACYAAFRAACEGLGVFPSVTTALQLLRESGTPLALVTGKGPFTTTMSLSHFGLDGVFDPVEVGSPQGVVKASAIARVVARWGVAAADVIYVGDAVADVHAAREAGVLPIAAGVGAECDRR